MRAPALLALALLALGLAVVGLPDAEAEPDASQAPWWGPGSPQEPGEGWHFRVPVTIENPHDHTLQAPTAQVELDLGQLLVDAGWNAQTIGARTFPTTFTLDEDSFRVLPYDAGFASLASEDPLPSRFYPAQFDADESTNYDPSRNPAGTLVFQPDGDLAPGETRSYVVYLAAEQHGDKTAEDDATLAGWAQQGWGTTTYGFTNVAQGRPDGIDLVAREPGTQATVYTFEGVNPQLADLPDNDNPLEVSTDELTRIRLPPRTFFKIEADAPVLVGSRGQIAESDPATYGGGAFVSSTTGEAAGHSFLVPGYTPQAFVTTAETGETEVAIQGSDGSPQGEVSLSAARPFATIDLPVNPTQADHVRLEADGVPILVQLAGPMTGSHAALARTGGPMGTEILFASPPGSDVALHAPQAAQVRLLDAGDPGRQLFPFGSVDRTEAAELEAWPPAREVPPGGANSSWPEKRPVHLVSLEQDNRSASPLSVQAGPGDPRGHFPLDRELRTYVRGPTAVFGVHNATKIEVTEPLDDGTVDRRTRTVHENGVYAYEPSQDNSDGEARLRLTKPATVVPTTTAETYADVLPSQGPAPAEEVGSLSFRGALVRLDTVDGAGGRSVTTVGPGQAASFDLEIANVGDFEGRSVTEDVQLTCEQPPTGWRVSGCKDTFTLSTDQSRTATVEVEAAEADPGERFVTTVTARGETWNVSDQVQVGAVVRESFDVDAWFFEEGGPKQRLSSPFLVEEGSQREIPVVVENAGTVEDTYRLDLADPQRGWNLEMRHEGRSVDSLTLDPGETATLTLAIEVEEDPSLIETGIELEVVSTANKLAFDKLRGRAQVASELNLTLASPTPVQLADPGETTTYPLEVANNGDGVVTVDLNVSSGLPDTWSVDLETDSVTLFPGNATRLSLDVTVPAGEEADERGTVRVTGETRRSGSSDPSAVLTALLRHDHQLTGPSQAIPIEPGPAAELNVPVVNTGNGAERLRLLGVSPSWGFQTPNVTEIPRNETGTLPIQLDTPSDLPPGEANLTLHLSLSRETQANLSVPLDVRPTPRLAIQLPDPPPLLPDREVRLNLTAVSAGNVPLSGNLSTTLPEAWNTTLSPSHVELAPGEEIRLVAHIRGPSNPSANAIPLAFRVEDPDRPAASDPMTLSVGRPDLALGEPSVRDRGDGGLLATVQLSNGGDVDARDVTVALVDGGEVVAQTTVTRLAPGQTIPVAVGDEDVTDAGGLALVADPQDELPDPTPEDNRIELGNELPFPSLAVLLASLAATAIARRWPR